MAGMCAGGLGLNSNHTGDAETPLLGDPEEQRKEERLNDEKAEKKSQAGARVFGRTPPTKG